MRHWILPVGLPGARERGRHWLTWVSSLLLHAAPLQVAEKNAQELVAEEERVKRKAEKKRLKKKVHVCLPSPAGALSPPGLALAPGARTCCSAKGTQRGAGAWGM